MDSRINGFFIGASMKAETHITKLFVAVATGALLIHAFSTIPFYIIISHEIDSTHGAPYAYIVSRVLRFILCFTLPWLVRKRYKAVSGADMKRICFLILLAMLFITLLHISGWGDKFYFTISSIIGIYDRNKVPLFLAVLWEQVFSADLLYSVLIDFFVIAIPKWSERMAT